MQEEVNKVLARAHWEAETETWTLARLPPTDPTRPMPLDPLLPQPLSTAELQQRFNCGIMPASGRPFTTPGARRPMCSLTKAALLAGDMNPRFRCGVSGRVQGCRLPCLLCAVRRLERESVSLPTLFGGP